MGNNMTMNENIFKNIYRYMENVCTLRDCYDLCKNHDAMSNRVLGLKNEKNVKENIDCNDSDNFFIHSLNFFLQ